MILEVREITRKQCEDLILNVHYARRWPSISFAFGLFDGDELLGVVTFGTPPSSPLRVGVAGAGYIPHILELNRLCLYRNEKNFASQLVGGALQQLKAKGNWIVVSFADTSQGHAGYVYQATNFTYHGLSAKRTDWKVKGMEHLHGATIADKTRGMINRAQVMRDTYGDDFYLSPRPRKHRYIFIAGDRAFRKAASKDIRYPQQPYPKAEQSVGALKAQTRELEPA